MVCFNPDERMLADRPEILSQLSALSEPTRSRLLLALENHELTVSELCAVLQLPQSTVSRHLKTLADGGWVQMRPDGTRRRYRHESSELDPHARELWELIRGQVARTAAAREDVRRLSSVIALRRTRSREFFRGASAEWDRLRDELFGGRQLTGSLLGLLASDWTIADLGCGTGPVAAALAPFVDRVVAVDAAPEMLDAARERLTDLPNVELRHGELEAVPARDSEMDAATLMLVLHHIPEPVRVLKEVARILRPGGKLLIVDMLPHERDEYRQRMGHVWLGFAENQLKPWLAASELQLDGFRALPADPEARGPGLFAAAATKPLANKNNRSSTIP
jgi:ArsR family transcriptional regulator